MPSHTINTISSDSTKPVISFIEWVKTLSPEDQAAADAADKAQKAILAKHQASGKLTSISDDASGTTTFVWAEGSEAEQAEHDPAFTAFMNRYKEATGVTHNISVA
jgi:hypothetical protein